MGASKRKNNWKGIIGTILFHTLVIAVFLSTAFGLSYQDPPPEEEGISINLGFIEQGIGKIDPENNEELIDVKSEIIENEIENVKKIETQNITEEVIIKKPEKEKEIIEPQEPKEEIIEEKKPEVNKKALYTGKKENNESSEGNNNRKGNQGVMNGEANNPSYEGGGTGGKGAVYQLGGRKIKVKVKPIYNIQIEGKVVVAITVNRSGNVTYAIPGIKGSTTLNKELLKRAKKAALKTKFDPKPSAPTNQQGKIIYTFQLN